MHSWSYALCLLILHYLEKPSSFSVSSYWFQENGSLIHFQVILTCCVTLKHYSAEAVRCHGWTFSGLLLCLSWSLTRLESRCSHVTCAWGYDHQLRHFLAREAAAHLGMEFALQLGSQVFEKASFAQLGIEIRCPSILTCLVSFLELYPFCFLFDFPKLPQFSYQTYAFCRSLKQLL